MRQVKIRSWNGAEWEGILLRVRGPKMRVMLRGFDDVMELWCYGGQWFAENGEPVQIQVGGFTQMPFRSRSLSLGAAEFSFESDDPPWLN